MPRQVFLPLIVRKRQFESVEAAVKKLIEGHFSVFCTPFWLLSLECPEVCTQRFVHFCLLSFGIKIWYRIAIRWSENRLRAYF